ncbi:MAG: PSD1 and planctomycete cytochrome C domain-containing protein [Pirellulales bacterium]
MRRIPCAVVALVAFSGVTARGETPAEVDFARDVQPLLASRCLECHDKKQQKSGFRLDVRKTAFEGGESGEPAIVPGDADASPLVLRVESQDESDRMPPEGAPLTGEQIALLRKWVASGAKWPDELAGDERDKTKHWAFVPPVRPELPAVKNEVWVRNAIDRFILAKLEQEGLLPSPETDRVTLIRRLSLDLIGLPPTIEEVEAFIHDSSPDAYEKLVDRLLASPHYGERWARHWLDAARYADSDGYEKDKLRWVWFFRDWVINALNKDLPYDQFIIEQLAGDQLPGATQDQLVATGFLRNSMLNEEGGIDPEQFRMEAMFDRMDAIGKSILGITIQCAQCHNHKFDPVTQEDYYRLFAFLNNDHEGNVLVYTPAEQMQRAEMFRQIKEIEGELQHRTPDWQEQLAKWVEKTKSDQPEWTVLEPDEAEGLTGSQRYFLQSDHSLLAQGYAPTHHTHVIHVRSDLTEIRAFRLELLNDPNLPRNGPGRSILGTGALTDIEIEAAPAGEPDKKQKIKIASATADVNPPEAELNPIYDDKSGNRRITGPIAFAIDGKDETAWSHEVDPGRRNLPRKAVFVLEQPIKNPGGTLLTIHLKQYHGGWNSDDNQNNNLGRVRLSITGAENAVADPLPASVRPVLSVPAAERSPGQTAALFSHWRTTVPEWKEANERIEALWKTHPEGHIQLVLLARDNPRNTAMLKRGDFLKPDRKVEPGVPGFLHPLPENAPATRLTFAKWLVDRNSPTAARSLVNRVWQTYFGIGLVSSSEDLGTQAEKPSHPELFDWLAVEFMDRGWSLKDLHRLIVTSATYRQSSQVNDELLARDPYNRLLAHGPRVRVEAEIVRDIALAASGLLTPTVGGPSVFPPLPEFMIQPPVSYGPKIWQTAAGPDRYRRGLYTFRYRSVPYPVLQTFDAPNGDFSCVRRVRSNTPLQALVGLNEPVFVECAQALAAKTLSEGGDCDERRLDYAFRRCLSRQPTADERAELLAFYGKQKERAAEGWLNPWQIAGGEGAAKPTVPKGATPVELAAWTAVSRVLLNLDETITKE